MLTSGSYFHLLLRFLFYLFLLLRIHSQNDPGYQAKIDLLLYNYSQKQTYILDYWQLPYVTANPSLAFSFFSSENVTVRTDDIIITWGGIYIIQTMTEEIIRDRFSETSPMKMVEDPQPIQLFDINNGNMQPLNQAVVPEDIHLVEFNNANYIVYNFHIARNAMRHVYCAQLRYNFSSKVLYVQNPRKLTIEHEMGVRHQKNWSPFSFTSSSIYPHIVVHANESIPSEEDVVYKAHTISKTEMIFEGESTLGSALWAWGEPRGGTPAVLINTIYGDKYLTFFHSSGYFLHPAIHSYFMGAYLFDAKPPFAISHFSSDPIIPNRFYNETWGWAYRNQDFIVFPMGLIVVNESIYLSVGHQDRMGWVVVLNTQELIASLTPVNSKVTLDRFEEHVSAWEGERINGCD